MRKKYISFILAIMLVQSLFAISAYASSEPLTNDSELANQQSIFSSTGIDKVWSKIEKEKDRTVKIAIIDTGLNLEHSDLKGQVSKYIDVSSGKPIEITSSTEKYKKHGTGVTGIIAANTNNSEGIAGLGDNKFEIIFISTTKGTSTSFSEKNEAIALKYATEQSVDVINMSYGGPTFDSRANEQCKIAYNKGITIVCASGNSGDTEKEYPADYKYTISVMSMTSDTEERCSFSTYGNEDISAIGDSVYTLNSDGGYKSMTGTSFSAPIVTAIVGHMYAQDPYMTPYKAKLILTKTARSTKDSTLAPIVAADKAINASIRDSREPNDWEYVFNGTRVGTFNIRKATKTETTVKLFWTKSAYATKYRIYKKVNGKYKMYIKEVRSTATAKTIANLEPNTSHYFKIKAVNGKSYKYTQSKKVTTK